ncbi:MAG: TonB-dependent receptor, partial [Emcibacter sp.]|nr:TonB-dependent receptor [Emcibacter sp.]
IDNFDLSYQADYSKSRYRNPLGTRGRFRERDELVFYSATDEGVIINATPDTDDYSRKKSGVDTSDASKFAFDNILIDDVTAVDKIYSARLDGKWNIEINDRAAYIKTGVKFRSRKKFTDKEQLDGNPADVGFGGITMADVGTYDPENTNLNNFVLIPNLAASQALFNDARDALLANGGFNVDSASDDFKITEKILAGYIMAHVELSDEFSIIAGARLERTSLDSDGTITETLRTCDDALCTTLTSTPVGIGALTQNKQYTDILPSLHFKYQPNDEVIMRLALTKAVKRPAFDENRPNIGISTTEQEDGSYLRALVGGNPNLETLRANQIDFLVSWYPNDNLAISAGIFYKDIKNFIVDVALSGDAVAQSGYPIGDGSIDAGFDSVLTFINGEKASLLGFELSYYQAFDAIPGVFVDGNVTWVDSKSKIPLIDPDRTFKLPDQPSFVGNFSIGYENEHVTFRLSGNYVGEKLETVASDTAMDEIRQSRFSMDFGARYNFNKQFQIYFDAINLNNAKDVRVFRNGANAPRLFERVEDYGRTFQLGVRASF